MARISLREGCAVGRLVGWRVGCPVGRSVGWRVGRPVGWHVGLEGDTVGCAVKQDTRLFEFLRIAAVKSVQYGILN